MSDYIFNTRHENKDRIYARMLALYVNSVLYIQYSTLPVVPYRKADTIITSSLELSRLLS